MEKTRGFYWVDLEIENREDVLNQMYVASETDHSYERTYTYQEVNDFRTAKGLPENAPQWANTFESRYYDHEGHSIGLGVEVSRSDVFTVIRLIVGRNDSTVGAWVVKEIFATKTGEHDDTEEYRDCCRQRVRQDAILRLRNAGFKEEWIDRFFDIPKGAWSSFQKTIIADNACLLHEISPESLCDLATTPNWRHQEPLVTKLGLTEIVTGMKCPDIQSLAQISLWIFHGRNTEDPSEIEQPAELALESPVKLKPIKPINQIPDVKVPIVKRVTPPKLTDVEGRGLDKKSIHGISSNPFSVLNKLVAD